MKHFSDLLGKTLPSNDSLNRVIVENRTLGVLDDAKAISRVLSVIEKGRISDEGKCYCFATAWEDGIVVYANRNKKSDKFTVTFEKQTALGIEAKEEETE